MPTSEKVANNTPHITHYANMPPQAMGYAAAQQVKQTNKPAILVCSDDRQMQQYALLADSLNTPHLTLPAWDCLPYDRISPSATVLAERLHCLCTLAHSPDTPRLIVTTLNAFMQKVPPRSQLKPAGFNIATGEALNRDAFLLYLTAHGYTRVSKVMEPGEFAVRGNIIDCFPAGYKDAVRIDLFGDDIESLKYFEPLSQVSHSQTKQIALLPVSEVLLNEETIEHFRKHYRELFGAVTKENPLYESITAGRMASGTEHWLPLFYEYMENLEDYTPDADVIFTDECATIYQDRTEQLQDFYQVRCENLPSETPYNPLAPRRLYRVEPDIYALPHERHMHVYHRFDQAEAIAADALKSLPDLMQADRFEALRSMTERPHPLAIACYSDGSRDRIDAMLKEAGFSRVAIGSLNELATSKPKPSQLHLLTLPIEHGFECSQFTLISEQDLLGERIIRTQKRKKLSENFIAEASVLEPGELIVHAEHGIGRFEGLHTLEVNNVRHDCLKLLYAGDDKLFLPVVNMEMLSRFGQDGEGTQLDKLGSVGWQKRKAAMKERIKLAAAQLLKLAARRATRKAPELVADAQEYERFCNRFPWSETEDQLASISDVFADLASGKPTDRLICGDVGFGKTEVALRAAFAALKAQNGGVQVAVVAPTTLLARQHYEQFSKRFEGFGIKIGLLSRMATAKQQEATKEGLKTGEVRLVIGTHALLSKSIEFADLGLVIVDEEQRFGVAQKERLKHLRANIHLISLSATPIPRTLQMALSGVRELSLITTPPVDRLAIRSFVMPFDGMVLREAIMREYHRGGQIFYVTPRVEYIAALQERLKDMVPDLKVGVAHGQMTPKQLEDVMQAFYDGKYNILLATTIIESGLDVTNANTMIIDHAELFGLAQLYQLRGRVGRGKTRAYAYFVIPSKKKLTAQAVRRLEVMRNLDTLGAGFTLASHDMDIRGFGNLLGEEQSGHVREVGVELYQHMLEDAIRRMRNGEDDEAASQDEWSPSISLGTSLLIPESYVEALDVRMQLYRQLSNVSSREEVEEFAAELIDRFGALPQEVKDLLESIIIKNQCRVAGIERLDTGPKGAVITFRDNQFVKPEALLMHITKQPKQFKIRSDQKLLYMAQWKNSSARMKDLSALTEHIASLAG